MTDPRSRRFFRVVEQPKHMRKTCNVCKTLKYLPEFRFDQERRAYNKTCKQCCGVAIRKRMEKKGVNILKVPVIALALFVTLHAQQFEVAAVHPNTSGSQNLSIMAQPGGRLVAENVTLQVLIRAAYKVSTLQIFGGPSWLTSDRFNVTAKTEADSGAKTVGDMAPMIQSLIEDRFSLKAHRDTRELFVNALTAGKKGLKIVPSDEGDGKLTMTRRRLDGNRVTMDQIAKALSDVTGSLVVDQSGFDGYLDIHILWQPDTETPKEDSPPPLFDVLLDQFGLVVKAKRAPVPVVVIDSVEKLRGES